MSIELELKEKDKYDKIWNIPAYRANSPGARSVPEFVNHASWKPGETIIDIGCGTGKAGLLLKEHGFRVYLLDLCKHARDPENNLPFVVANIWKSPQVMPKFDWIYCVDVLEHMPTEYVGSTLDNLAKMTKKGGYLQIACFQDGFGAQIGETLHLTVQKPQWWYDQVAQRWNIVKVFDNSVFSYAKILIGEPHAGKSNGSL